MDPFTLLFLAVFVWGTNEALRDVRARSAARTDRIEGRRAPRTQISGTSGDTASPARARARRDPDRDHRHLGAPHRAARAGSRAAAAVTTYPALAWLLPRSFFRGWRHGRMVGRAWRANGGDLDAAKREAAGRAQRHGWHIPDWARPDGPQTRQSKNAPTADPHAPAQPATPPTTAPPATTPDATPPTVNATAPPSTGPVGNATSDRIDDIELIPAPIADSPTPPKGPTMSNITPAPTAAFDNGDYNTLHALAGNAQRLGEEIEQHTAAVGQLLSAYVLAAEAAGADAAAMHVDPATQGEITELHVRLSEARAAHARLAAVAEAITEAAAMLSRNLTIRHGGINDAVIEAPIARAADGGFYGTQAA